MAHHRNVAASSMVTDDVTKSREGKYSTWEYEKLRNKNHHFRSYTIYFYKNGNIEEA